MNKTPAERKQLTNSLHAARMNNRRERRKEQKKQPAKRPRQFSNQDVDGRTISFFTGLERVLEEGDSVLYVGDARTAAEISRGYNLQYVAEDAKGSDAKIVRAQNQYANKQNSPAANLTHHHPTTRAREEVKAGYVHVSLDDPHALDYLTIASETVTGPITIHVTTNPGIKTVDDHPEAKNVGSHIARLFDLEAEVLTPVVADSYSRRRPITQYSGEHVAREPMPELVKVSESARVEQPILNPLGAFLRDAFLPVIHTQQPKTFPAGSKRHQPWMPVARYRAT